MSDMTPTPQFEEEIRAAVAHPLAREEFVKSLHARLMQQAASNTKLNRPIYQTACLGGCFRNHCSRGRHHGDWPTACYRRGARVVRLHPRSWHCGSKHTYPGASRAGELSPATRYPSR